MGEVQVRRAVTSDARQLAVLRWDFMTEDRPLEAGTRERFADRQTRWFADALAGDWAAWVAEDAGRLVGHLFVRVVDKVPSPHADATAIGYVTNYWVVPDHRGQGYGARMLHLMTDWAPSVPLDALVVWPSDTSVAKYEAEGFTGGTVLQRAVKT